MTRHAPLASDIYARVLRHALRYRKSVGDVKFLADSYWDRAKTLEAERDAALDRVKRLEEALNYAKDYVEHTYNCSQTHETQCNCGLTEWFMRANAVLGDEGWK